MCISFIHTLGTHTNQIIVTSRNTHTHSISADISLIVKSAKSHYCEHVATPSRIVNLE